MTKEEKELLLKDLCARLLYSVIVYDYNREETREMGLGTLHDIMFNDLECKLYLRPMSSMTEEEFKELTIVTELQYDQLELKDWDDGVKTLEFYIEEIPHYCIIKVFDWLNAHHFDYRGFIEKGLALEAPEGMYNLNK